MRQWLAPALLFATPACANPLDAPLPVHQMNPALLRHMDPAPATASISLAPALSLITHHASIFLAERLPAGGRFLADMEISALEPVLHLPVTKHSEIRLTQPLAYFGAGVLDPAIRRFHRIFHMPDNGRHFRPDNSFGWRLEQGSRGTQGWRTANAALRWKTGFQSGSWRWAIMLGHSLPTGSPDLRGPATIAPGVSASFIHAEGMAHAAIWWLHPWKKRDAGHRVGNYYRTQLTLGARFPWLDSITGASVRPVIQIQGGTTAWRSGIPALDNPAWLVSFGFNARTASGRHWSFTFEENITQQSTHDFGVSLAFHLSPFGGD